MKRQTLMEAIYEAERFIRAAEAYLDVSDEKRPWKHPRESGSVRRASLDLTRKLADLRQGR